MAAQPIFASSRSALPAGAAEAVPMFFSAADRALARWCPAVCRNSVPRVPSGASY
ncbi:hypothetical protein [Ktedonobacter racemifer]|uniref:hypothetical protein n=1 Tax=Ktedonobacter racemifer TaxID=363277 RepID=UPI0012F822FF|nr:hypothetical protein [Ktedonobacter racemifer]